jgi:hypothetical protein
MEFFRKLLQFVQDVARDERIPERDKVVVGGLLLLILSPVDLIPDWIPVLGMLDDIAMIALVLDYLVNTLDERILLSHYPFGMKSYSRLRRLARILSLLAPKFLKRRIWAYTRPPY